MMKSSYEKRGGSYIEVNGYRLPDLKAPEPAPSPIGVWGMRHEEFLKEHRHSTYITLLTTGKLDSYLADINEMAVEMMERLVGQMAENEGVTEQLKAENQMEWVRKMNNIRARSREIVYEELIIS